MRLRCIGRYRSGGGAHAYAPGDVIEVAPDVAAWLLRDAPGSFEAVGEPAPVAPPDAPPADRMVRAAHRKGGG